MKKIILSAVCLFSISTAMNAQETVKNPKTETVQKTKGGHEKLTVEQRAQKHVDALGTEITLADDQKPKIYELALVKVKKVDEIRAKYKGQEENKEVMKNEITAVKKEFRQSVKALLTPEQLEKLKAKHQEMKAAGKPNSLDKD